MAVADRDERARDSFARRTWAGAFDQLSAAHEDQPGRAFDALTAASDSADLVVVGSRGLHGLKALGSVSERVANQARSSVLVVRT